MEPEEDLKIPDEVLKRIQQPELFKDDIDQGKSLQEILGYSDEVMDKLYQVAHNLFEENRYHQALDAFLFLSTMNPFVYAYWLGLGMVYQVLEEYEQALLCYECAHKIEMEEPLPLFHMASCNFLLNDMQKAKSFLKDAKKRCVGDYSDFLEKVENAEIKMQGRR